MKKISIQDITIGPGMPLAFFAGPCVIESREHVLRMAEAVAKLADQTGAPMIFKASYDKANRTAVDAFRGPGVKRGAEMLAEVKERFALPILTDVHEPWQVEIIAPVVDVLQVPALLCRQTDLILAVANSGRVVNVKKGQFLSPWEMKQVIQKVTSTGNELILVTERGSSFGYNNLVSDLRSIPIMQAFEYPVVFDATHSAQLPGGEGSRSGGMRRYIPTVARGAVAAGANAIFMEIHDDVEHAKSDAATQWPLQKTRQLIEQLQALYSVTQSLEVL